MASFNKLNHIDVLDATADSERSMVSYYGHLALNAVLPSLVREKQIEAELRSSVFKHPIMMECGTSHLEQALSTLKYRLPNKQFIRYCIDLGDFFLQHGDLGKAEEAYSTALARKELHDEHSALGEALIRRGGVYLLLGRRKESNADLNLGRRIYRCLRQDQGAMQAESMLAINYASSGDTKKARFYLERTLNTFERIEEKYFLGLTQLNLGIVYDILGDPKSALSQFQRARSHFEEVGDLARLGEVFYKLGTIHCTLGSLEDAQSAFEMCYALSIKARNRTLTGLSFFGNARVNYAKGDIRIALTLADQALDNFSISNDRLHVADVYRLKGTIHRQLNNSEFAHWYLYTSLKMYSDIDHVFNAGDCYYQLGLLRRQQRQLRSAVKMLQKSVDSFRKGGALAEAKVVLAEISKTKQRIS